MGEGCFLYVTYSTPFVYWVMWLFCKSIIGFELYQRCVGPLAIFIQFSFLTGKVVDVTCIINERAEAMLHMPSCLPNPAIYIYTRIPSLVL